MTKQTNEATPRTLVTNQKLPPIAYQIQLRSTFCQNCKTKHEYSETFELRIYRNFKNLTPIRSMSDVKYNMPTHIVRSHATITPFCHECFKSGMFDHLPRPPRVDYAVVSGFQVPPKPTPAPSKKRAFTLDDL